jgi:CheY-like chemotaxis protein
MLARGELQTIGATTLDEYRKHLEKDAALERRFQPIKVPEPTVAHTIDILKGLRDRYEAHHRVQITDQGLVAAANLAHRYISDRYLPDKAIDVIDDGPGMSEALAAQVFEPFFTTKAEGEGTGLGLSISQGIVKEHGGRIMLSSEEGRGSTFTVQLPLSTRAAAPPPDRGSRAPAQRLRVLVVDDEPHILHYMRATLEAWGHVPVVASNGEEALASATQEEFDLIISDLRMPRFGGREFYEELLRRSPKMAARLVFSTGDTVRGDTLTFLETLDRPYLHKPFSLAELRALLAEVARESDSPAALRDIQALPADILPGT